MKSLDELFAGVKTAAIAGHIRPDGDCVGSCLATYNYITTYYPQIEVSLYLQPIPNIFKFMKNADKIISDCTADKEFDLFIAQDCGDLGRLGDAAKYFEHAKKTACMQVVWGWQDSILRWPKAHFVLIIISVTRVLRMKTIFSRRRVLRRNWYLN